MDKIWYRNPSKSGGHCGGDEKTRMTTQNRQKSQTLKQKSLVNAIGRVDCSCPVISNCKIIDVDVSKGKLIQTT